MYSRDVLTRTKRCMDRKGIIKKIIFKILNLKKVLSLHIEGVNLRVVKLLF